MRIYQFILPALMSLTGLSGCTSMSALECLDADWHERGYTAQLQGLPLSEVLVQQNACVQHGVVPDRRAFATGWRNAATLAAGD